MSGLEVGRGKSAEDARDCLIGNILSAKSGKSHSMVRRLAALALLLAAGLGEALRIPPLWPPSAAPALAAIAAGVLVVHSPAALAQSEATAPAATSAAPAAASADASRVGGKVHAVIATADEAKALKAAAEQLALPANLPADSDLARFLADDTPSRDSSPRAHN